MVLARASPPRITETQPTRAISRSRRCSRPSRWQSQLLRNLFQSQPDRCQDSLARESLKTLNRGFREHRVFFSIISNSTEKVLRDAGFLGKLQIIPYSMSALHSTAVLGLGIGITQPSTRILRRSACPERAETALLLLVAATAKLAGRDVPQPSRVATNIPTPRRVRHRRPAVRAIPIPRKSHSPRRSLSRLAFGSRSSRHSPPRLVLKVALHDTPAVVQSRKSLSTTLARAIARLVVRRYTIQAASRCRGYFDLAEKKDVFWPLFLTRSQKSLATVATPIHARRTPMSIQKANPYHSDSHTYAAIDRAVRARMMCLMRETYDLIAMHILWIDDMNRIRPFADRSQLSIRVRLRGPLRMTLGDEWAYITIQRGKDGQIYRQRHYIPTRSSSKRANAGVMRRARSWEGDATHALLVRIHEIRAEWGNLATVRRHLIGAAAIAGEPYTPEPMPEVNLRKLVDASKDGAHR